VKQQGFPLFVKRAFDRAAAAAGLIALAPVLAAIAAAVRLRLGSPVLFRQERAGWRRRPFHIVKFRTMREARGPDGRPLPDAERLTPLGRFLRSASLDELPQLAGVVKGDLSLVGPRPLPMAYLERCTPDELRRYEVLPGITGMAAVSGRNLLSWDDRFRLDLYYVDHWSPWLDAKILLRTVRRVVAREGVASAGHATSPEFRPPPKADPGPPTAP
jgi:lipopolysaccharide/colanic/teichoic acid biosynthesis glycosyltransferase